MRQPISRKTNTLRSWSNCQQRVFLWQLMRTDIETNSQSSGRAHRTMKKRGEKKYRSPQRLRIPGE